MRQLKPHHHHPYPPARDRTQSRCDTDSLSVDLRPSRDDATTISEQTLTNNAENISEHSLINPSSREDSEVNQANMRYQNSQIGGLGEGLPASLAIDPRTPGRDLRLLRRAINNRWEVPEITRKELVPALSEIVLDRNRDDRARVSAAMGVLAADRLNLEQEKHAEGSQLNITLEGELAHSHALVSPDSRLAAADAILAQITARESIADAEVSPPGVDGIACDADGDADNPWLD